MPDIKTRDSLKTIKTFQRAGAKVKDSSAEAKRRIEETQDHGEASESEYSFTDKQKKTMREMLDSYFDDMWDAVLSEAG